MDTERSANILIGDEEYTLVLSTKATKEIAARYGGPENPGDKVMIFSPFYENYGADAILSGAEPIYIPLVPPTYEFDISLIEKGFAEGAKALILCNPSNPCGKVFTREELEIIAGLAKKYDVYVITDEVYEHIIYAPHQHTYFATLPDMWERTLSCSSLSKTYSITGWRLGYIIAPPEIIDRAKRSTTSSPSARRRPYRRPSSPVSTSVRTTTTRCRPSTRTKRTCS